MPATVKRATVSLIVGFSTAVWHSTSMLKVTPRSSRASWQSALTSSVLPATTKLTAGPPLDLPSAV